MNSPTIIWPDAANERRRHCSGNFVWDAGFETWKCELHRYGEQEILLDRCARAGDRLRVEAVRWEADSFAVAYTLSAEDSELPKCLSLVSNNFPNWGQATECMDNLAAAFARNQTSDPRHAVHGHWNGWHIIRDEAELLAWRWDGESVFDLKRQAVLLDTHPEQLRRYASSVPLNLTLEDQPRSSGVAMRDRYLMDVVAVDRQGYALIQITWSGRSGLEQAVGHTVLPVRTAQNLVAKYRRSWFGVHGAPNPAG